MGAFLSWRGIRNTFNARIGCLVFVWILGLIVGAYTANTVAITTALDLSAMSNYSLVGLILSLALPLVVSFICIRFLCFSAVLPLVVLKAFSFACAICYITHIYGNAGWLVCGLALFTDSLIILLLIVQWYDAAIGKRYDRRQYFYAFVLIPILIGMLDYFVVSPFLAMLLNY